MLFWRIIHLGYVYINKHAILFDQVIVNGFALNLTWGNTINTHSLIDGWEDMMIMSSNTCRVEFNIECGLSKYVHLSSRGDNDKDLIALEFVYYV